MNLKPQTGAYCIFYHLNLNTPSSSSGGRLISILMGSFPLVSYAALEVGIGQENGSHFQSPKTPLAPLDSSPAVSLVGFQPPYPTRD